MEPVDEKSHQDQQEERDHHVDAHDVAVLFEVESEILVREEEVEHRTADQRSVVARHREEEPAIEREAEAFAEVGCDHAAFLRFGRRIFPLLYEETHQQECNQIHFPFDGVHPNFINFNSSNCRVCHQ